MPTKTEEINQAVMARLQGIAGPTVKRADERDAAIPTGGLIVMNDLAPANVDGPLGNRGPWYVTGEIDIEVLVHVADEAARHAALDALLAAVEGAFAADITMGGLIYGFELNRPEVEVQSPTGDAGVKGGIVTMTVEYQSDTRL